MRMLIPTRRDFELAPWAGLRELENSLDRIFYGQPEDSAGARAWHPAVDVTESEDAYLLDAEVPGVKKEDLDIEVHENVISLRGKREREEKDESKGYRRLERVHGSFERRFRLPEGIDADKVEARFADGVLHVRVPKPERAKPKQIKVQTS